MPPGKINHHGPLVGAVASEKVKVFPARAAGALNFGAASPMSSAACAGINGAEASMMTPVNSIFLASSFMEIAQNDVHHLIAT